MIIAPVGWSYPPGTDLAKTPEELPDLPSLAAMPGNSAILTLIDMLTERPNLLEVITGNQLQKHYKPIDKYACYASIEYARAGKRPKPFNRTSNATASKITQSARASL